VTGRRGFTLLEVMIAVAISAIGIVSLLELFGGSMRLARAATEQTEAMVIASSVMDKALWRAELPEESYSEEIDGYQWTLTIEAIEPQLGVTEDSEDTEDISDDYELYEIVVEVHWGDPNAPKALTMKSLRLMEKF
jgi:type II secretion system protein I